MSILKIDDNWYQLECDLCECVAEEDFDEFMGAVEYKKENGWKSVKMSDGGWEDRCPNCK